jgi:hypothetical protein
MMGTVDPKELGGVQGDDDLLRGACQQDAAAVLQVEVQGGGAGLGPVLDARVGLHPLQVVFQALAFAQAIIADVGIAQKEYQGAAVMEAEARSRPAKGA